MKAKCDFCVWGKAREVQHADGTFWWCDLCLTPYDSTKQMDSNEVVAFCTDYLADKIDKRAAENHDLIVIVRHQLERLLAEFRELKDETLDKRFRELHQEVGSLRKLVDVLVSFQQDVVEQLILPTKVENLPHIQAEPNRTTLQNKPTKPEETE